MEKLIIIIAAVVIAAVVIFVIISKKKKTVEAEPFVQKELIPEEKETPVKKEPPVPVTFTEDFDVSFEGLNDELEDALLEHSLFFSAQSAVKPEITKPQVSAAPAKPKAPTVNADAYLEKTTVVTQEDATASEKAISIISSFLAGTYYFDGEMIAGGEKTPMEIAMLGNDFQIYSELDGKDISIMQSDSKTYMLNPDTKKFTQLTASFQKMVGIDATTLKFSFNSNGIDSENPTAVKKAVFNENEAVCYIYKNEKCHIEFIANEENILQMALFDNDGKAQNILIADEFTAEIPDGMLTFQGYSKTNMISFLSSLM